jgi:Lactoylglutathione lyase and related lyases
MKVISLDHITINVKDIEKSFEFYQKVLELERLEPIDLGDRILHYFKLYDGCRLELIQYLNQQKSYETGATDIGIYRHFAVVVKDLDEIKQICDINSYKIRVQPFYSNALRERIMLIEDPNGVELEMIEFKG